MGDTVQKSCWGVTAWAVAAIAGAMMLAWLFGNPDAVAVAAVAAS